MGFTGEEKEEQREAKLSSAVRDLEEKVADMEERLEALWWRLRVAKSALFSFENEIKKP